MSDSKIIKISQGGKRLTSWVVCRNVGRLISGEVSEIHPPP